MEDKSTRGIRTHFWLERTYIDACGEEHFQTDQLSNFKLWQITQWVNLTQIQVEFPDIQWEVFLRQLWEVDSEVCGA